MGVVKDDFFSRPHHVSKLNTVRGLVDSDPEKRNDYLILTVPETNPTKM